MQRSVVLVAAVLAVIAYARAAAAQPGMQPPMPAELAPAPLSAADQQLLVDGEISDGQVVGGVLVAAMFGFGTGQLIEQRWNETGWKFMVGDAAALGLFLYGVTSNGGDCGGPRFGSHCGASDASAAMAYAGVISLVGLRIWETADAAVAPAHHNRRVRALRARAGLAPPLYGVTPFVAPRDRGAIAGLGVRF